MAFRLNITKDYGIALLVIQNLNEPVFKSLVKAVGTVPIGTTRIKFHKYLQQKWSPPTNEGFAEAIFGLGDLINRMPSPDLAALAKEMVKSMSDIFDTPEKKEIDRTKLTARILPLLKASSGALAFNDKAYNLWLSHQHVSRTFRVITDTRFVFEDAPSVKDKYAMLFHQLEIWHSNDGNTEKSYFSMDISDVIKLRAMLDRAIDKEASIKAACAKLVAFINFADDVEG